MKTEYNYKESERPGIIGVDIDGTLTYFKEGDWKNFLTIKPNKEMIEKVNCLYNRGWVILIYTSRLETERRETEAWLKINGVKYWALIMEKLRVDYYMDDRSYQPDDPIWDELLE